MDKESVLKNYAALGINAQKDIYEFILNNTEATVGDRNYVLSKSNESMEFMANFLGALNFNTIRFYLEKNGEAEKNHWFLAFYNGEKWFYYEPCFDSVRGKHVFTNFNSLITYAVAKVVKALENTDDISTDIYEKYTLKEIICLPNFDYEDDVRISKKGNEVLIWSSLNKTEEYDMIIKKAEEEELLNRNYEQRNNRGLLFFGVGFTVTIVVGLILIYLLAKIYVNK